jgi:hypothetical protein
MDKMPNNKSGATLLLMTLLILTSIITVTLIASEIVRMNLIMDRTQIYSTTAFFAAEAGAERILYDIRSSNASPPYPFTIDTDPNCQTYTNVYLGVFESTTDLDTCNATENWYTLALTDGAKFKLLYSNSGGNQVLSYGSYNGLTRAVQLNF